MRPLQNRQLGLTRLTGLTERRGHLRATAGVLLTLFTLPAKGQEVTHASLAPAGGRATGGGITNDATLGDLGSPAHEDGTLLARPGFAGQLWDATSLDITPQPAAMTESSTLQLAAQLTGDDGTTQPFTAGLTWESASIFLSIDAAGLAASTPLPGNQSAIVSARSGDLAGSAVISLFDLVPDDYGPFARDNLDDGWQWAWFGNDPASGAPGSDPDNDGQDNALEFLAGTTPLDGASFLQIRMEPEPFQPAVRRLFFAPFRPDRSYTWEWSSDFQTAWQPVAGDPPTPQPSGEARATDEAATEVRKFYRLQIE